MKNKIIIGILAYLGLIVLINAIYIVHEEDQVVLTQFGKPVGKPVTKPGLYFKIPVFQVANYFEKRYMEWNGAPNQLPTRDKKFIFVDSYARWQITDPLQFFKRLTNEKGAQSKLDDIIDGATRNYIADNNIEEAVRNSNRTPLVAELEIDSDSLVRISVGRQKLERMILETANKQTADLGITILDFRIKRINYVKDVQNQVFKRMISERHRIADKFRSEGQGEALKINGEKEKELKIIQSSAVKDADEIIGVADAQAAAIYARAYDQSSQAKSLYAFLKSMETIKETINNKTSIFLSTDSELYKYLKNQQ